MSLAEVFPQVQSLSRQEKHQLLHLLVNELAPVDETFGLIPGASYPAWSPHDAYSAAEVLLKAIEADKAPS